MNQPFNPQNARVRFNKPAIVCEEVSTSRFLTILINGLTLVIIVAGAIGTYLFFAM